MAEAPPDPPTVSVVLPVRNRRDLLGRALDALDLQTFTDFEVVVVDDGSTDGSGELAAARTVAGRAVLVVPAAGDGAVAARTLGVRRATGRILAFTDSDCEPSPQWLDEAVRAVDAGADLVNGRTVPARPPLPLERSMESGEEGLYPTCNLVVRRSSFDAVGGFDHDAGGRWGFRPDRRSKGDGFGEDTILAWELIRSGATARYVPNAIVRHSVFPPDAVDTLSRTARVAAFPAMLRDIPELRPTMLRWGWQLGARTRLPLYALLVAALTRRWPLIAAAAAWWVGLRLHELRRFPISWRRRAAVVPVELGIDVITAGALAVGSVRSRHLVL